MRTHLKEIISQVKSKLCPLNFYMLTNFVVTEPKYSTFSILKPIVGHHRLQLNSPEILTVSFPKDAP